VSVSAWDIQTSGQATSAGGTGKTTVQMKDFATYLGWWDIIAVDHDYDRNTGYIWNIVDDVTYAFLSWQPV
jgi:MinD superfamily P-loop ATPase